MEIPKTSKLSAVAEGATGNSIRLTIGRSERGDSIPTAFYFNDGTKSVQRNDIVVMISPNGVQAFADAKTGDLKGDAKALFDQGYNILLADLFLTGSRADAKALANRKKPFGEFFNTYNRTNLQERVQDVITVCAQKKGRQGKLILWGTGGAGLWAILAGAGANADAVIADAAQIDLTNDAYLLESDNYVPGLRRMGDIRTALTLVAPKPVLLYSTGSRFAGTDWVADVYRAIGSENAFHDETSALSSDAILEWLGKL
ncbi:hypothetical protein LBMAG21_16080 [Armatimonadota bacterium]|nr:hypothetical protein LBMAG21_16080 [Armatimonadota bacterium]